MNNSDTSNSTSSAHSLLLAIELSNPNATVGAHAAALFSMNTKECALIGSMPIPEGIKSSDGIMILIQSICNAQQVNPSDIGSIAVSVGPGGYTALRIACTTAKVLAQSLDCELFAIPTSKIAAQAIEADQCPALIALASKNDRAYCAIVEKDGSIEDIGMSDASVLDQFASDQVVLRSFVADSHAPSSFVEKATELGISVLPIVLDARSCLNAMDGVEACNPMELKPLYAREPDAVTQWRARSRTK